VLECVPPPLCLVRAQWSSNIEDREERSKVQRPSDVKLERVPETRVGSLDSNEEDTREL